MRWKLHVRFGERTGETDQPRCWHRAPVRLHWNDLPLPLVFPGWPGPQVAPGRVVHRASWPARPQAALAAPRPDLTVHWRTPRRRLT